MSLPIWKLQNRKTQLKILCSKLQGIFDRKECGLLRIRSPTPPHVSGNALAIAVYPTTRLTSAGMHGNSTVSRVPM